MRRTYIVSPPVPEISSSSNYASPSINTSTSPPVQRSTTTNLSIQTPAIATTGLPSELLFERFLAVATSLHRQRGTVRRTRVDAFILRVTVGQPVTRHPVHVELLLQSEPGDSSPAVDTHSWPSVTGSQQHLAARVAFREQRVLASVGHTLRRQRTYGGDTIPTDIWHGTKQDTSASTILFFDWIERIGISIQPGSRDIVLLRRICQFADHEHSLKA